MQKIADSLQQRFPHFSQDMFALAIRIFEYQQNRQGAASSEQAAEEFFNRFKTDTDFVDWFTKIDVRTLEETQSAAA